MSFLAGRNFGLNTITLSLRLPVLLLKIRATAAADSMRLVSPMPFISQQIFPEVPSIVVECETDNELIKHVGRS
jgi:hypothetical protein